MDFINTTTIYFFIYAVLGWVCEIVYCSVLDKKFQNRGFLYGPYCPIYGFGALIIIRILLPFSNDPLYLFFTAIIACTVLEYITSWVMEKVFHLRWWDYSKNKFNINGRVCLWNSFLFGILGLVVIYGIHPFVVNLVAKIPASVGIVFAGVITVGMTLDFIFSVLSVLSTSKRLMELRESFDAYKVEQKLKRELRKIEWEKFIEQLHVTRQKRKEKTKSAFAEKLYSQLEHFDMSNQKLRRIINNQSRMDLHGLESVLSLLTAYKNKKNSQAVEVKNAEEDLG